MMVAFERRQAMIRRTAGSCARKAQPFKAEGLGSREVEGWEQERGGGGGGSV